MTFCKMKALLSVLLLVLTGTLAFTQSSDPFDDGRPEAADRRKDKGSKEFLDDQLLGALGLKRLDEGVGKGTSVIRITVLRSFHPPLSFSWYPAPQGEESWLRVRRLKMEINSRGQRGYKGLDLDNKIKLRPDQGRLLKEVLHRTEVDSLPQACWQPEGLIDGSEWIFEVAEKEESFLISRRSPIDPQAEGAEISKKRLAQEMHLTAFALVIWTLSGIEAELY